MAKQQAATTQAAAEPQTKPVERTGVDLEAPLLDQVIEATSQRIDAAAARYAAQIGTPGLGQLKRAMLMAQAISNLEKALDATMMTRIMWLMNKKLGFKTDRGPGMKNSVPYSPAEVKLVVVQGLLAGVFPVNNEFNIISGELYIARNGWQRKVEEIKGITDIDVSPSIPHLEDGRQAVRVRATWRLDGKRQELLDEKGQSGRSYALITNSASTPDNLVGKAMARAYRDIFRKAAGSVITIADDDMGDGDEEGSPGSGGLPRAGGGRQRVAPRNGTPTPSDAPDGVYPEAPDSTPEQVLEAEALHDVMIGWHERIAEADTTERIGGVLAEAEAYRPVTADLLKTLRTAATFRENELANQQGDAHEG